MAKRGSKEWLENVRNSALKKIASDPEFLARRGAAISAGHARNRKVRSHCKRGHELTWENTEVNGSGYAVCRACHNLSRREAYARRAEMIEGAS